MQDEKLIDLFDDIRVQGYDVPLGGAIDRDAPGNFVPVTVVDNPPDDSRIVTEEPFGPVLPILSFADVDEVVRRANDTEFGRGGSVWGPPAEAAAVAVRLETGTVWVDEIHIHGVDVPFGGHKQSGMGVEHGAEGPRSSRTRRRSCSASSEAFIPCFRSDGRISCQSPQMRRQWG